MKTLRIAALAVAVSGVFTLGAKAGTDTNNWWDVTFDDKLGLCDLENQTVGPDGAMVVLTQQLNNAATPPTVQTWDSGIWYTQDGDETIVTNSYNPTNTYKAYGSDLCLKLDTQGNDLTWRVDPTNTMADSRTALVDADLYLVGSDSPPDASDFDPSDAPDRVQTAVYLKNETDEDTGETTNSVLCVYVYDSDAEENYWQELKGVKVEDNSWASVKVVVDHAKVIDPQNDYPVVQVFVNGVKMTARDGNLDHWTVANSAKSQTAGRVSSVAFRGTGAVDNFVGKLVETTFDSFTFTAEVYMNGNLVAQGTEGNVTRVEENVEAGPGKVARFEDFLISNYDYEWEATDATWALSKVVVIDQGTGEETTYHYEWDGFNAVCLEGDNPALDIDTLTGPNGEYQTGLFDAIPSTAGATKDGLIIKIYFDDLPEDGTFNAKATTTIGEATTTDVRPVKPSEFDGGATKTITWEFPAVTNGNVLSTIQVYNGADLVDYADKTATVSVTLDAALLEHTLFAAATYVPGTLAEGQDLERTKNGDTYTFAPYTPPVAIIIAGNVTNKYDSLRGAITNATAGDTIYLVADDSVSFTADDPILDIDFEVTIVGGSNTLYGMTDYAGLHEIRISGSDNVTIKDLKLSEFGDTAPLSQSVMPICTRAAYEGKLVLDGVTIDKFNRQALLLCGGEFLITNSVITGCAGEEGKTSYFQSAIETYYAKGDVGDTTITGIGALNAGGPTPDDEWAAAVFTVNPLAGADGTVKVTSGYYEGQFIVAFNPGSVGAVTLEGGTFVATAADTEGAFLDDSEGGSRLTISGGWFDREPEADYIAEGLAARQIGTDPAPWTVGQSFTITFNNDDGTEFYKTNGVFTGETGYGPATDPTKGETFTFVGWTNLVAGGAAVATADLPAADGNATWTAVFKEDSVIEPIAVDPGTSLTAADKENGDLPIEVTAAGFVVKFRSSQPGIVYQLVAAGTCDLTEDQWKGVATSGNAVPVEGASKTSSATTSETNTELITLTAPMTDNVKFFKIRASLPDGN